MLLEMEGRDPSSGWFVVRDVRAAQALNSLRSRTVLLCVLGRERTASEVAADTGLTLNAAYLQLRLLCGVGLARIAREVPRGGRAVKHYASVADRLFVPFELTGLDDLEAWYMDDAALQSRQFVTALLNAYRREWGEPHTLGVSYFRDSAGSNLSTFGPRPGETWSSLSEDRPATLSNAGQVWLSREEAKALQRELYALHARHSAAAPGRRPYRLTLGLAPEQVEERADTSPVDR